MNTAILISAFFLGFSLVITSLFYFLNILKKGDVPKNIQYIKFFLLIGFGLLILFYFKQNYL